ncbi:MAG TPA: ribosomal protein L13e [Candidatus Bathyarchaeia archaeon]|nr:ribosomal protein L13e [Candidatus Bathyarchaeia archaeon]
MKKFAKTHKDRVFSREELREAGLDFRAALKLSLPVDTRRKSNTGRM